MCGRYVLYGPHSRLKERFSLAECPAFGARYNIAPTSDVLVVRYRPEIGRVGQMVRWGLIPSWAKDMSIGAKLNNARAETVAEKPSFRTSFARHRCLIPANGFYEWKLVSEGGKIRKQPYYVRPAVEEDFFAFAGLLARWRSPEGQDVVSTCIITTAANAVMEAIHERMPAILPPEAWKEWLDPESRATEALEAFLRPAPDEAMVSYPVSTAVNRADSEGEQLILPAGPVPTVRNKSQLTVTTVRPS